MDEPRSIGFLARLWLAIWLPFKVLFDALAAARVAGALGARALELPPVVAAGRPPERNREQEGALHLLAILQREGRFVDFVQEDIASLSDAQVGAAVRVVQEGCRKGLAQVLRLEPVRAEEEGAVVLVEAGFDAGRLRLTGNVVGQPPFRGRLAHHGWHAAGVDLPPAPAGQDPSVLAPAEIEI